MKELLEAVQMMTSPLHNQSVSTLEGILVEMGKLLVFANPAMQTLGKVLSMMLLRQEMEDTCGNSKVVHRYVNVQKPKSNF